MTLETALAAIALVTTNLKADTISVATYDSQVASIVVLIK